MTGGKVYPKKTMVELGGVVYTTGKFTELADGSAIFRDQVLLTPGKWGDSLSGNEYEYTDSVLQEAAKNWYANGVWVQHTGGGPRSALGKVAVVENQRWQDGAVMGDIHFHQLTQESKDAVTLIKSGIINSMSVELGNDGYTRDKKTGIQQPKGLTFLGVALVENGACRDAKFAMEEKLPVQSSTVEDVETRSENMDENKTQETLVELGSQTKAAMTKMAEMEKSFAVVGDISAKLAAYQTELSEVKAKLAQLESQRVTSANSADVELEEWHPGVRFDTRTKRVTKEA